MRIARVFLTPLLILAFVSACENTGDKEAIGTVLGAGVGAGLGAHAKGDAKVPTMILGALIGGYIGNRIGNELDEADRLKHRQTTYEALEYGRSYETEGWRNPDNNTAGRITPQPAFENDAGQPCREFQQTIMVGGREEQGYGTACRQEDGSWKIVSTQ